MLTVRTTYFPKKYSVKGRNLMTKPPRYNFIHSYPNNVCLFIYLGLGSQPLHLEIILLTTMKVNLLTINLYQ